MFREKTFWIPHPKVGFVPEIFITILESLPAMGDLVMTKVSLQPGEEPVPNKTCFIHIYGEMCRLVPYRKADFKFWLWAEHQV